MLLLAIRSAIDSPLFWVQTQAFADRSRSLCLTFPCLLETPMEGQGFEVLRGGPLDPDDLVILAADDLNPDLIEFAVAQKDVAGMFKGFPPPLRHQFCQRLAPLVPRNKHPGRGELVGFPPVFPPVHGARTVNQEQVVAGLCCIFLGRRTINLAQGPHIQPRRFANARAKAVQAPGVADFLKAY